VVFCFWWQFWYLSYQRSFVRPTNNDYI